MLKTAHITKQSPEEFQWLREIEQGCEISFHKLFQLYVPYLQTTLFRIVRHTEVAEDIIQEVFIRIWLNRDKLTAIRNPRAWILRIAYTRAFTHLANAKSYHKTLAAYSVKQIFSTSTPEDALTCNQIKKLIGEAIQNLPRQQQLIYKLSREEGMHVSDIASTVSISPQSVKNALSRALASIRNHVEKSGYLSSIIYWLMSL